MVRPSRWRMTNAPSSLRKVSVECVEPVRAVGHGARKRPSGITSPATTVSTAGCGTRPFVGKAEKLDARTFEAVLPNLRELRGGGCPVVATTPARIADSDWLVARTSLSTSVRCFGRRSPRLGFGAISARHDLRRPQQLEHFSGRAPEWRRNCEEEEAARNGSEVAFEPAIAIGA